MILDPNMTIEKLKQQMADLEKDMKRAECMDVAMAEYHAAVADITKRYGIDEKELLAGQGNEILGLLRIVSKIQTKPQWFYQTIAWFDTYRQQNPKRGRSTLASSEPEQSELIGVGGKRKSLKWDVVCKETGAVVLGNISKIKAYDYRKTHGKSKFKVCPSA